MLLSICRLAVAALLVGQSYAQSWANTVNISMCTWGQVRANTIRDRVYLDGGDLWWLDQATTVWHPQIAHSDLTDTDNRDGLVYYLDLSSSFNATTNLTSLFGTMEKAGGISGNIAPTYQDGVMFANDYGFYLYGGDEAAGNTVLQYRRYQDGEATVWSAGFESSNLDGDVTRYVTNGAGVSSPSENLGFYISGMRDPEWGPIWRNFSATNLSQQMITLDMSDQQDAAWSNVTLPDSVQARANAEAVWVPVSESGIVVLIGGVINPESLLEDGLNDTQEAQSERVNPGFMDTVSVYDVANQQWYNQNTTGDTPPPLTQFCSVYATSSDGSSHNIYIYGGYDGINPTNRASDDVYVLSLPSFEWILLYTGSNQTHGRKEHKCVKPYPDQMFVLGGEILDSVNCVPMVEVFNLNTGRFQDSYSPADWSDYEVPVLVSGRIGGDASGGATRTSPESWTDSSLEAVFAATYSKTIETFYPYNDTNSNITTTIVPESDGGGGFPGWAGAVIGVVLAVLLIAGLLTWWFLRRRKQKNKRRDSEVSRGTLVSNWMEAGAFAPPAAKDPENETVVSGDFTNESTVAPSITTGLSRPTAEAAGDPVYEMPAQNTSHAVELPTPFNQGPLPEPSPTSSIPSPGYSSPVSPEIPQEKEAAVPGRPGHQRNVSSLSSVQSYSRPFEEDDGRITRPQYVSGVSEASVSSAGTRFGEPGPSNRGLGLEDIPDTEGDR
ncbi:hypothetical protein BJX99DRAFT_272108 [Aspergillus californicus]